MKGDDNWIVGEKRLHEAVAARQIVALGNEGAEDAVENDEHPAVIVVDIFGIGRVMHAMMRGRVQYIFEPAKPWNPIRVQPELIEQVQRAGDGHCARLETEPHERHIEDGRPGQPAGPPKPVGCSKIEVI